MVMLLDWHAGEVDERAGSGSGYRGGVAVAAVVTTTAIGSGRPPCARVHKLADFV